MQVIDYTRFASLPEHLAERFGSNPFDAILDTVGSQALYQASPGFLKSKGSFVNVGTIETPGQVTSLLRWAKNSNLPTILGGVPRKYIMFSASLSGENAEVLARLADEGKLRVIIDSVFALEDALKVIILKTQPVRITHTK